MVLRKTGLVLTLGIGAALTSLGDAQECAHPTQRHGRMVLPLQIFENGGARLPDPKVGTWYRDERQPLSPSHMHYPLMIFDSHNNRLPDPRVHSWYPSSVYHKPLLSIIPRKIPFPQTRQFVPRE